MTYDVAIIGAGHNGLTAAGYLAAKGLKVVMLERRDVIGGAAVTTEFSPGYRNSEFSYVVSLLDQHVIRDLELSQFGLDVITREGSSITVDGDTALWMPSHVDEAVKEISKFSRKDAEQYRRLDEILDAITEDVRNLMRSTPYNLNQSFFSQMSDMWKSGRILSKMPLELRAHLAELMTKSVGDYLNGWFETDILKGTMAYSGSVGNFASPYHPSTAYVLLHHHFGQANGKNGAWGHAKGGMGAITQAMAKSAQARGVDIRTDAEVDSAIIDGDRIRGLKLSNGEEIKAKAVLANCHPQILFGQIIKHNQLAEDFSRRIKGYRSESGSFRMNVALKELPQFTALKHSETPPELMLNGSVNIMSSIPYVEQAWRDATDLGWAREPVIEMCIPTLLDDSLAPSGHHVMSLFCQHFRRELPDGRSWDDARDDAAETVLNTVEKHAPGFRASIIDKQINSPLDIERKLNMIGGDIFHGSLHADQLYAMRPVAGAANYRMPFKGLYLGGSGAHPGGGVSGLPGRNAALAMIKDRRKWAS
jgi:phytoene dehydrogenase-like protein